MNLLGGEISGNTANTTSASVGAIYAYQFASINVGGNMVIKNNYKGTSSSASFGDLNIGTKKLKVASDFSGDVYVYSDNNYQFKNVFGNIDESFSITNGRFHNNRNAYLFGTRDELSQVIWDYDYSTPSTIAQPTTTNIGTLRRYAFVDPSGALSATIYKDIALPILNPTDYTVVYNSATDTVSYTWNDTTYGSYSFDVPFIDCDIVTARSVAKDALSTYLAGTPSQGITDIINTGKTQIDAAIMVSDIIDILDDTKVLITAQLVKEAKDHVQDTLNGYIASVSSPSTEILSIISDAVGQVTSSNYEDTSTIIADAKVLLDAQLLKEAKKEYSDEISSLVSSFVHAPSSAVLDLENNALSAISEATSAYEVTTLAASYEAQINALYRQEQVDAAKAELDQLVASLTATPSTGLASILAEAKTTLDNVADVNGIDAIVASYADEILAQRLDEVATQLADTYNGCANTNRHEYDNDHLQTLDDIFDSAESYYNDVSNDIIDKITYLEDAIGDLQDVTIARVGEFNPDDTNFDEDNFDSSAYHGVLTPTSPLPSDAQLRVSISEMSDTEALYNDIVSKLIVPTFNQTGVDQIRDQFVNQIIFAAVSVSLVDGGNVALPPVSGTEYTITLLIPENYRDRSDISIVYPLSDSVEVFGTTRNGNLITFTTNHFGTFYLIGDANVGETSPLIEAGFGDKIINLWWIIILLLVVMVAEIVYIVFKHLSNKDHEKQEARANISLLPLIPFVVIYIPNKALLIILILAILVIGLGIYSVLLFLGKAPLIFSRKKEKAEESQKTSDKPEIKQDDLPKPEK